MHKYYEVQTLIGSDWENVWHEDDHALTFTSEKKAREAVDEFFRDLEIHDMADKYSRSDYRVVRFEIEVLS